MAKIEIEEREVTGLLARLAELEKRLATLESDREEASAEPASVSAPKENDKRQVPAPAPVPEEISEETVFVISAAVAAYFGKHARIRAIHLVSSGNWAQQGRASIMASHRWVAHRG